MMAALKRCIRMCPPGLPAPCRPAGRSSAVPSPASAARRRGGRTLRHGRKLDARDLLKLPSFLVGETSLLQHRPGAILREDEGALLAHVETARGERPDAPPER